MASYKNAQRRGCPYKPFCMGSYPGLCVSWEAVKAEYTRSGAIANISYITMPRTHCNHRAARPLWVISRHFAVQSPCPLYPRYWVTMMRRLIPLRPPPPPLGLPWQCSALQLVQSQATGPFCLEPIVAAGALFSNADWLARSCCFCLIRPTGSDW